MALLESVAFVLLIDGASLVSKITFLKSRVRFSRVFNKALIPFFGFENFGGTLKFNTVSNTKRLRASDVVVVSQIADS